jgi:hypothetical protein
VRRALGWVLAAAASALLAIAALPVLLVWFMVRCFKRRW